MAIKNLIQLRKGSSSEWSNVNPVLASGEPGYDFTNNIIKVGDGVTSWNNLSSISASSSGSGSVDLDTTLVAGTGINFSYDGVNNTLTILASGLQPSGNYSVAGHSHLSSDITNFNSGVSGLLPSVSGSEYVVVSLANNNYTISTTGLQPSGSYANSSHSHNSSDITNFNSAVSGLLPITSIVSGAGILVSSNQTSRTINVSSDITDSIFHPFLLGGM